MSEGFRVIGDQVLLQGVPVLMFTSEGWPSLRAQTEERLENLSRI